MGDTKCLLILMLDLLITVLIVQGQPSFSIEPATWYTGTTLNVTCDLTSMTTGGVFFFKDNDQIYTCLLTNSPCSDKFGLSDYSDVDWSQTGEAGFTISNADSTRDDGTWSCSVDDTTQKSKKIVLSITDPTTTVPTTTVPTTTASETNDVKEKLPFMAMTIPLGVLFIVFFIVTRHKTLVIRTLYVKVSKNTVQLSWKPEFEPVPDTLYAKCAQNGLTENAEIIDGLFVVVFRDLVPGQQHDVTVYCQNAADMKLYKSETCVVFTLKDSSNTNPKESKAVLALHSLDLTVYQTKVELSWTSPLAFDSTKVEYWVGSDKHITMSADKTSLATSNAEMTRLLPDSVITFTITGEKNGTQYRSGVLHQKTLKGLTGCCP